MDTTATSKRLDNIMFIDIETVPLTEHLTELPDTVQSLWLSKADNIKNYQKNESADSHSDEFYFNNAGIYSEFAKIVCISIGVFARENDKASLRIKISGRRQRNSHITGFCVYPAKILRQS